MNNLPSSYYKSKECEGVKKLNNPYKQRLWWAMFADNYLVVDRTRLRCDDGRIGEAYVKCYKMKEKDKNYVTILKRFDKPIFSCWFARMVQ